MFFNIKISRVCLEIRFGHPIKNPTGNKEDKINANFQNVNVSSKDKGSYVMEGGRWRERGREGEGEKG